VPKTYTISELFKLSWPELTTKEHALILIYTDQYKAAKEKDNYHLAGHYAIMILKTLRKNKNAVAKMEIDQVVDVISDITFFNEPWFHFNPLQGAGGNKLQPENHLKNHTFGQLCRMDALFSKWAITEHNDMQAHPPIGPLGPIARQFQNELIAVIYCPPDKYNETEIEASGKLLDSVLTDEQRIVITATYANIKKFIIDGCPTLFTQPSEDDGEQPTTNNQQPQDTEPMWEKLLFALAETPAYPGIEKAKAAPMYEALNYLEHKAQQAIEKQRATNE
jgi:hypothetical protein